MLTNLTISDLAVVQSLDLDFGGGMSVLTGETGAGKSILLTALGLALGNRADSDYVRDGAKNAQIYLQFDLKDSPKAQQWLDEQQLTDANNCLIRRNINSDGGSKSYINDRPVTLQSLRQLGNLLVEIHGQHDHLMLLDGDRQRHLLDNFAGNAALLEQTQYAYTAWKQTNTTLDNLRLSAGDQHDRQKLLAYHLQELQQLDLANFDYQALTAEHSKQANLQLILQQGQAQLDALDENEQQSVNQTLVAAITAINEIAQFAKPLTEVASLLGEAQIQLAEAASQLRHYLRSLQADPQHLQEMEEQIGVVQTLARKHQTNPEQLPQLAKTLASEMDLASNTCEQIAQLTAQLQQQLEKYQQSAAKLSQSRCEYGNKLAKMVTASMQSLGMESGYFVVQVAADDRAPTANGYDKVQFLVATNQGLPAKPLAKIASGGELSRLSLAIQVNSKTDTATMIFDEVDAGIGGGIAEIVGQKLRQLGSCKQILCVTHLPQVASCAHQHLFVQKQQNKTTSTSVTPLNPEQKIQEIARMLGGITVTDNSLAHAAEMLHGANTAK